MTTYDMSDVAFVLVDGYSIAPRTGEIGSKITATIDDITPVGVGFSAPVSGGLKSAELTHSGFYDDVANSTNDAFVSQEGVSRIVCYGVEGNTIGKEFTGFAGAFESSYERVATRGQIHRANGGFAVSGKVEDGVILHALGVETADGTTEASSVNNGAGTASGGTGYLQLTSLTLGGYTNLIVIIEHSVDDIAYADLVTFVADTAAPDGQRIELGAAATVNQYQASSWSFTGAGTGQSATFMAGFVRTPDPI